MVDIPRVPTGVEGLDALIDGGLPEGSVTLVAGGAGAGKTILSSQFLWHGLQQGESVRFITLEEQADSIKEDMALFGWDVSPYEEDGRFKIEYVQPAAGERGFLNKVNDLASEPDVSRLVIDSVSIMLGAYGGTEAERRSNMYDLVRNVKQSEATTILTSEIRDEDTDSLSRYNVAEFVADGVIVLYYEGVGEGTFRNIEVRKIRKTAHTPGTFPFEITDDGITVRADTGL